MALNLKISVKRTLLSAIIIALTLYIVFRILTGNFGPVPLRVNVSNADLNNIVVKLKIKGIATPFSGGHATVTRVILHEEEMLIKSNETTQFPRAYMWMAFNPVEYAIEIHHPAVKSAYRIVKISDLEESDNLPVSEISTSFINQLIDSAKSNYDIANPQQQELIKSHAKDQYYRYQIIHIRDHYIPAMQNANKNQEDIYNQVQFLLTNCEKLFSTFDFGRKCELDEVFFRKMITKG